MRATTRPAIKFLAASAVLCLGLANAGAGAATRNTKRRATTKRTASTVATTSAATPTTAAVATTAATTAPPTTAAVKVPGCEKGWTDPRILDVTRQVARCAPNTPAPKPLPQKTKVRVSSSFRLEFNSPLLLADSFGEFAKENIEMEFVPVAFGTAVPQLASGAIDVAVGGFELALFNAGLNNLPVKVVMGNYYPPKAGNYNVPQTGLWCRRDSFADPKRPNLREVEVMKWASSVGRGSSAVYYSAVELGKRIPDFQIKRVEVVVIPSADTVTALKNKAIDCGVLLDPVWLQVRDDPNFIMVATQTPGEPLGQYSFGKRLLVDQPEIGDAFMRAFIRTVNTYFAGDYHEDAKVLAEIGRVTNQPTTNLRQVDSLVMDWEVRSGTTSRVQELFIDLGVITDFKTPVPEDKLVDRSFYERAVGKR